MKSFIVAAAVAVAANAFTIRLFPVETGGATASLALCTVDAPQTGTTYFAFNGYCSPAGKLALATESCAAGKITVSLYESASATLTAPPTCTGTKVATVTLDNSITTNDGCQVINDPVTNQPAMYGRVIDDTCDLGANQVPYAVASFSSNACTAVAETTWWPVVPGAGCVNNVWPGTLAGETVYQPVSAGLVSSANAFDLSISSIVDTECDLATTLYPGLKTDGSNCIADTRAGFFTPTYAKAVKVPTYTPPKSGAASTVVSVLAAAIALLGAGRLAM